MYCLLPSAVARLKELRRAWCVANPAAPSCNVMTEEAKMQNWNRRGGGAADRSQSNASYVELAFREAGCRLRRQELTICSVMANLLAGLLGHDVRVAD
jgi:hypothetical protein